MLKLKKMIDLFSRLKHKHVKILACSIHFWSMTSLAVWLGVRMLSSRDVTSDAIRRRSMWEHPGS